MSELLNTNQSIFEEIRHIDENGNEFWMSRELGEVLEYSEYRHFLPVIKKAKDACNNSKYAVLDHFGEVTEMVGIGSNTKRSIKSVKLSRYACYLIVQNADPSKEIVARWQNYFAVQTRIAEIKQMDEYTRLSTEDEKNIKSKTYFFKYVFFCVTIISLRCTK